MKSRKRDHSNYEVMRQRKAPEEQQREAIFSLTAEQALKFDADFEEWAHRNQLPPGGEGWRTWLMMAGRGFGKTRAGAEWIFRLANGKPGVRLALVGATIADARSVMVEGVSGLVSVARRYRKRLRWEPSLGRLKWPNGSEAQLFSGDNADGLRGPEFDFGWADELAKWRQAESAWDNLQMALRRGPRARALVTTTPRPGPLLERIRDGEWTVTTTGRTSDNINLDERFIDVMTATYGGTRLGAQELDGVLLQDVEGALWTREMIERARVEPLHHPGDGPPLRNKLGEDFDRIVVGVDPPAGAGEGSDACGIVDWGHKSGSSAMGCHSSRRREWSPASVTRSLGLEPDSAEIAGALSAEALEERDLALGRWDSAAVQLAVADWLNTDAESIQLLAGEIGQVAISGTSFTADLNGAAARLDQPVCPSTSAECRAEFGDKKCRVDLAGRTREAIVVAGSGGALTLDTALDDQFVLARLRYMSGANCGLTTLVLAVSGTQLQLRDLPRATVETGCRIEVREGCDKRFQTCVTRFANAANFRGEPHLPGNDLLTRYPGA